MPLYSNWHSSGKRLLRRSVLGIPNAGWHHLVGITLEDDYNMTRSDVTQIVSKAADFADFVRQFYRRALNDTDETIWAEKTPCNVFAFDAFLNTFPDGKLIHIVRHPEDCIASLVNRGMPVYQAVCAYLSHTIEGTRYILHPKCFTIKYEDLTDNPDTCIQSLMAFLGLEYNSSMIEGQDEDSGIPQMQGWKYKETQAIQKGSVGRFTTLSDSLQNEIANTMRHLIYLSPDGKAGIREIADTLNYTLTDVAPDPQILRKLKKERRKDILKRTMKVSYFNILNYPIYVAE